MTDTLFITGETLDERYHLLASLFIGGFITNDEFQCITYEGYDYTGIRVSMSNVRFLMLAMCVN